MARKSSIDRLPPEVQALIGELRRGGRTIDEILDKLRELAVGVSRSALGRHVKQFDAIVEQLQQSRTIAEAIADRFGDRADDKMARANIEMMHALMMKLMVSEKGDTVELDPQDAMFLATALQRLSGAAKTDVDRTMKLEERIAARERSKAADTAATVATEAGLSKSTVEDIRAKILGVSKASPKAGDK